MEVIYGKDSIDIDEGKLEERLAGYGHVLLDIGTGDGRYVRTVARACPALFAIGLDASRENLRASSRSALANELYVIANALSMPPELHDRADHITINFPWGSLLRGLVEAEDSLLQGMLAVTKPGALLEVRLNAGALNEAGWSFEEGGAAVGRTLGGWLQREQARARRCQCFTRLSDELGQAARFRARPSGTVSAGVGTRYKV